jgi:SPP1 gp7 family putative phage head morphogenesis protein
MSKLLHIFTALDTFLVSTKAAGPASELAMRKLNKRIQSLFDDTMKETLKQLKERGPNSALQHLGLMEKPLQSLLIEEYQTYITKPGTTEVIRNKAFAASTRTMGAIRGSVTDSLALSYGQGLGTQTAAIALRPVLEGLKDFELERVARTETHGIQGLQRFGQFEDMGVRYQQWRTAKDNRVRSTHRVLEGEIVAIGTPFSNGLLYPGDTDGPIEEWINCRCTAIAFLIPADRVAPWRDKPFRAEDLLVNLAA